MTDHKEKNEENVFGEEYESPVGAWLIVISIVVAFLIFFGVTLFTFLSQTGG